MTPRLFMCSEVQEVGLQYGVERPKHSQTWTERGRSND